MGSALILYYQHLYIDDIIIIIIIIDTNCNNDSCPGPKLPGKAQMAAHWSEQDKIQMGSALMG